MLPSNALAQLNATRESTQIAHTKCLLGWSLGLMWVAARRGECGVFSEAPSRIDPVTRRELIHIH